jgi:glycerol-3-phosphate dehydrogenase
MKVVGLQKADGKVVGISAVDLESQSNFTIAAKVVINATGVFVDDILQMDQPGISKNIVVSQGVHLVLEQTIFPGTDALLIPETSDGRVLFIMPWHGKILMGTTDTPVSEISLEPVALESEIEFILSTAGRYLTVPPKRKDVVSVFAGLRPLAAPSGEDKSTKEVSRSHKILVAPSGLFSMIGGKWTTYRKMGEDMMDRVEKELQWEHKITRTNNLPVHGYTSDPTEEEPLSFYGSDQAALLELIADDGFEWISEKLSLYKGQLTWAVREEAARTVEDFLSRRTRSLLLDAHESIRAAPLVARLMAAELHKDATWMEDQVQQYNAIAANYLIPQ